MPKCLNHHAESPNHEYVVNHEYEYEYEYGGNELFRPRSSAVSEYSCFESLKKTNTKMSKPKLLLACRKLRTYAFVLLIFNHKKHF